MPKRMQSPKKHAVQTSPGAALSLANLLGVMRGAAVIAAAAFVIYFPSLNGGFLFDDANLLTENDLIRSPNGLYNFWCTTKTADYWPATNTTLWMEWRLWGMSPAGYHVTNLVLHVLEALLVWIILRKMSIPGAFWAALIFAVHPVNVESAAWISSRKNLMAMLFFLLSILWYLKYLKPAPLWVAAKQCTAHCPPPTAYCFLCYWLSLVAFVLAMLSKGSAAVLPVLLLGIVWWLHSGDCPDLPRQMGLSLYLEPRATKIGLSPFNRWDLLRTGPFFLVAAVLAAVNVWFQTHGTGEIIRSASVTEHCWAPAARCGFTYIRQYCQST